MEDSPGGAVSCQDGSGEAGHRVRGRETGTAPLTALPEWLRAEQVPREEPCQPCRSPCAQALGGLCLGVLQPGDTAALRNASLISE